MIHEIAALWPTSQARLLSAIETGAVAPLGGSREHAVDVRVIVATSKNLEAEARAGRFRQDLLYRIGVLPIHLPPLNSHREDIPGLVREFLRRLRQTESGHAAEMDSRQIHLLKSLDWPRNVQQLQEVVENVVLPRSGVATADDSNHTSDNTPLALVEKDTILAALDAHDGNRTRAAESLGISVRTLQRRLQQWRLDE
jgi:DNA-binding NtrC family response regulator